MSDAAYWNETDGLTSIAACCCRARSENPNALRTIPDQILQRALEALEGEEWDEDAAYIIANVGRAKWDNGEVDGLLLLRRLYQKALRRNLEDRSEIMYSLCEKPLEQFSADAQRSRLSEDQVEANPMSAVEACYFGPDSTPPTYLQASCVLMAYRDACLSADPSGYVAAMYALREGYALYYAGQIEAARQAVEWAMPQLEFLGTEREDPRSAAAGVALRSVANAAGHAGDYDGLFDQLHDALRFLPSTGEHRAAAVYQLADEFKRRGRIAECLRWLSRVLETPGADAETIQMVQMELSTLRAELEGNPAKLTISPALAKTYGIPAEFAEQLSHVASQMVAGNKLSDESILQLMDKLPAWIDYQRTQGNREKAFSALVFMLKLALSLDDQTRLPISYNVILQQANAMLPAADATAALEHEQLRSVAQDRVVEQGISRLAGRGPLLKLKLS
jgi:tetratricopeptide (TPR) repeat protein